MTEILFKLICSHAVADFCLQNDFMAKNKNRHLAVPGFWPYLLSAHALTQGLGVYLVTNNVYLGIAETVVHWIIDFGKCEKWFDLHIDQTLHIACKVLWALLLT